MPALDAAGTGIDIEEVVSVVHPHAKDVGMPAYENVRTILGNQVARFRIIIPRGAADMGHEDLLALAVPETELGMVVAEPLVVAVAVDAHQGLEGGDLLRRFEPAAEIARVPDFVDRREEVAEFLGKDTVGVGYETDIHQRKWIRYADKFRR